MEQRQLGLVLGGGGFRGSAHLGVIYELERLDVVIDLISGTSIGALIGALVAANYRAADIERALGHVLPYHLLGHDREGLGLIGSHKFELILKDLFGSRKIENLRIPFAAVTMDITTGQEVVLDRGFVVDAILASSAIPGIFPPRHINGQWLVDGGVLNNLPVDVAYRLGADRVIAVNLVDDTQPFQLPSLKSTQKFSWRRWLPLGQTAIAERAVLLMIQQITRNNLRNTPPDILLSPDVYQADTRAFLQVDSGIVAGKNVVAQHMGEIQALHQWRLGNIQG